MGEGPAQRPILTRIDCSLLDRVVERSRLEARGRFLLCLHGGHSDALHRMINAIQPGSYVRPHRHVDPPKPESFILLRGAVAVFVFDESGRVVDRVDLDTKKDVHGVDVPAAVYHCVAALEADSVVFETKPGPWVAGSDKQFAAWAPPEGDASAAEYLSSLLERGGR